jgi:tRNA (cmo5U34)-methyltransferase
MSKVGDGISASHGNWTFGGDVAKSFDQHVSKSVPLYTEGHDLICDLSDFFVKDDSVVYELGCSTGQLIRKISEHNLSKKNAKFIGIDIEQEMIDYAKEKGGALNLEFYATDAIQLDMESSDLIVCYYTVQFINPSHRQQLINKIYESLRWGGAFLLFEKVRGADARFQDILTMLYSEYKLRMGYSAEDILSKARSLKGVLEPFSSQGNIDMLKRAGFSDINTIQKYLCFEGFLAIK